MESAKILRLRRRKGGSAQNDILGSQIPIWRAVYQVTNNLVIPSDPERSRRGAEGSSHKKHRLAPWNVRRFFDFAAEKAASLRMTYLEVKFRFGGAFIVRICRGGS